MIREYCDDAHVNFAIAAGIRPRGCDCETCSRSTALCPAAQTDVIGDAAEFAFSLEHLRILTGPICETHWGSEGEIVPATIRDGGRDWCEPCHESAQEGAWESHCSDFYGGSGPSDQDRFEAARDCGRKL